MDSTHNCVLIRNTTVRILSDDWSTFNKIATVIDPEPVPGSSQMLLDVDGDQITLARGEVEKIT